MRYRLDPYGKHVPFRRDNRKPDGTWDAADATEDNIKDTSVDPYDPVWPQWKQMPPADEEGDFVSDDPFFDIDEITQTATFYPPGTPLVDKNVDGNPATRQRVRDFPTGNHWRRRLLLGGLNEPPFAPPETSPDAKTTKSSVIQSIKPMDITGRTDGRVIGRWYELVAPSEKGGVFIQQVDDLTGTMYFRGRGRRNVSGPTPYTEILGEVPPRGTRTGQRFDDQYARQPGETLTLQGDISGRGRIFFLEGKTIEQLKMEGFNNPSSRTKLPTGGKLGRPGRYEAPAGTPEVSVPFTIRW